MFANEAACLGAQFEDVERSRIVNVDGSTYELVEPSVELCQFWVGELSALQFLTRYVTHVDNQSVNELHVSHFKREHSNWNAHIHCHALHHGEDECCLTHSRTGSDDDEVGGLPSVGGFVQFLIACGYAGKSIGASHRFAQFLHRLVYDWVDLCVRSALCLLRYAEEVSLCLLHQFGYVLSWVKSIAQDLACKAYELAGLILLVDDLCLILDMGAGDDVLCQLGYVHQSASLLQLALRLQILWHSYHIHRTLLNLQRLYGLVDYLMAMVVERLGSQQVRHLFVRLLFQEQSTEDGLLEIELLRLFVTKGIGLWHLNHFTLGRLLLSPAILTICWHIE